MSLAIGKVNLISDGLTRTGSRKDGKGQYYVMTAYIDLGNRYPEKLDLFVNSQQEVLAAGAWTVPVTGRVYNGRLFYDLDYTQAVPVKTTATQSTTPAPSKATV